MTSHDFRLVGLIYLISTSDELSNTGSKASLVFFGISASIFLDCSYSLASLLWPQKRHLDDDDLDRRPPVRHFINTFQKRLQLSSLCLLFILGCIVIAVDIWTSNKAAVARAMGSGDLTGAEPNHGRQTSVSKVGETAFWLSSWVGAGFMIHRAHIVYVGNPWRWKVLVLPALLYLSSIVTGILSLLKSSLDDPQRQLSQPFTLTCLTLIAALNSILTISICVKLYFYRRHALAQIPESPKRRSRVRVVWDTAYDSTAVFVESSALSAVFSVIFVGMFASGHESTRVVFPIFSQIQVLSPLLIGYHICKDTAWRTTERSLGDVGEARLPTETGSVILDTYHTGPVSLGSFDIDSRHDASRVYSINVVTRSAN